MTKSPPVVSTPPPQYVSVPATPPMVMAPPVNIVQTPQQQIMVQQSPANIVFLPTPPPTMSYARWFKRRPWPLLRRRISLCRRPIPRSHRLSLSLKLKPRPMLGNSSRSMSRSSLNLCKSARKPR